MAGKIVVDTIESSAGNSASGDEVVQGCAKAWVNFNGTGTVAIRDDFNVDTVADNGVGIYTVNLVSAMSALGYSIIGSAGSGVSAGTGFVSIRGSEPTLSAFQIYVVNAADAAVDLTHVNVAVFGD